MRYFLEIDISKFTSTASKFNNFPSWLEDENFVRRSFKSDGVTINAYHYSIDKPSIVEANWNNPQFENAEYFLFIGGSVYYRIPIADKIGKYVPTPDEVFEVLILNETRVTDIFKGNYYFVLVNKITRQTIVYSAPFALYPLWYTIIENKLLISNIMESLLASQNNINLDRRGLLEFALFDHTIGERTLYQNVYLIEGGYKYSFLNNEITKEQIYDIRQWFTKNPESRKTSLGKINYVLSRHINEFIRSSEKFNVSLTGGFDGRLNFSFIPENDYSKMQAFSYGKKGSNQINIPMKISKELDFRYNGVELNEEFLNCYNENAKKAIWFSGGITPFVRAMYPYAYAKASNFSRSCIIGQCDFIKPQSNKQPAGAIFNEYIDSIFFEKDSKLFLRLADELIKNGYFQPSLFKDINLIDIYNDIKQTHIIPYLHEMDQKTIYWMYLYNESKLKFWHTECHIVDVFVNDFISFSDLDYIEPLLKSQYAGLYKGVFSKSFIKRRKAHDLYIDLMAINNSKLNFIETDRLFKPIWYKYLPLGYLMAALGKLKQIYRSKKLGNDTFSGDNWKNAFFTQNRLTIERSDSIFREIDPKLSNSPYDSEKEYRRDRFISLKIWFENFQLQ